MMQVVLNADNLIVFKAEDKNGKEVEIIMYYESAKLISRNLLKAANKAKDRIDAQG